MPSKYHLKVICSCVLHDSLNEMELFLLNEMFSAKTEKEDREMKEVSKLMSELEEIV